MEDQDKEKTIVRCDFVGSKKITDDLYRLSGLKGIEGFLEKITSLRQESLKQVISEQNHRNNIVLRTEGDAAYLIFENADHAYLFAEEFLENSNKEKFQFRIGAATGDIGTIKVRNLEDSEPFKLEEHILLIKPFFESIPEELKEKFSSIFEEYNEKYNKLLEKQQKFDSETIGKALSDAVRLQVYGSKPGGFCIDDKTYQKFSQGIKNRNKFNQISVKGKNGEKAITAWHCQMIAQEKINLPDEHNTITTDTGLKLLRSLNYSTNENYFKQLMNLHEVAFLVQEQNVRVQNWLIERLIYHVPNSIDARKYLIDFQSYALSSSVEYFWHEFKDISTEENPTVTSIVDNLASLCQNKTIIITMRKLNFLDQETINKIFDFWHGLVNKVRLSQNRKLQSRLVLLLVAESKEYNKLFTPQKDKFNFINPTENKINQMLKSQRTEPKDIFMLSPMKNLPPVDVQNWLQKTEILSSLKIDAEYMDTLVNTIIPYWGDVPENVINNICETIFKFTDGIAEIEPMWRW